MSNSVITRFAPSPTGRMHLGNARTALFNALFAAGHGGRFLLRIEDTDASRGAVDAEKGILADLDWLGLGWDESALQRQSERRAVHDEYLARLTESGHAYPCFCTEEELRMARKAQIAAGKAPRYPGTCAGLDEAGRRGQLEAGRRPTLRFRVPAGRMVVFNDLVRGEQRFESDAIGDFVLSRADGSAAFFFANALDDALGGISHVLRGEDHVANTPRQLLILEALELDPPAYGHLPLLVGEGGEPLSKRRGSVGLAELRAHGYLPLAVANYLARLGHHYDHEELADHQRLASGFSVGSLGRAPARYDEAQLRHWQKLAVAAMDEAAFMAWAGEAAAVVPADRRDAFVEAVRPNCEFPADAIHWAAVIFGDEPAMSEEARAVLKETKPEFFDRAAEAVKRDGANVEAVKSATGEKGKGLFMPLRAALTGEIHGPELKAVLDLLGPRETSARLSARGSVRTEDRSAGSQGPAHGKAGS